MTMLMHTRGPLERASHSSASRDASEADAARAHVSIIKRFCISALTVVTAAGAIGAIVASKAALFLWVFHYY